MTPQDRADRATPPAPAHHRHPDASNEHTKSDAQEDIPGARPGIDLDRPLIEPALTVLGFLHLSVDDTPAAVIAAWAGLSTAEVVRQLQYLTRIGLATPSMVDHTAFHIGLAPLPCTETEIFPEGSRAAAGWYISSLFETGRVLGAEALPNGEQVPPNPLRPPYTPADRTAALQWFSTERGSLVRELERACASDLAAHVWRMALLMLNITCFSGPRPGWRSVYRRGIEGARRDHHRGAEAMVEEYGAKLELAGGDPAAARSGHQRALRMRTADEDALGVVRSVNALGVTALREDKLAEAEELFVRALVGAIGAGSAEFEAYARMNLGACCAQTGRTDRAVQHLGDAIAMLRGVGRDPYVANALEDLARAYRLAGDLPRARQCALEAERAAVEARVPLFLPGPLVELALLQAADGDLNVALAHLHEARGLYEELGNTLRAARAQHQIDEIRRRMTTSAISPASKGPGSPVAADRAPFMPADAHAGRRAALTWLRPGELG